MIKGGFIRRTATYIRMYVMGTVVSDIAMGFIGLYTGLKFIGFFKEEHHEELYGKPINN
ncbi:MAG: hypothetical protein K2H34_06495 [Lachnospiraceae bacterium]|nr:hypothetical protein [Lachnospiraceae bacterium]